MYRLTDVGDDFATFVGTSNYSVFAKFGSYDAAGPRRLAAGWKPPRLTLVNPELPLPDWAFVLLKLPIVSARAVEVWGDLLAGCAEALPVHVDGTEASFFALNIFAINALDLAESRFRTWPSNPEKLKTVTRVVFCSDVAADLFVLRHLRGTYCSQELRTRATAAGLLGFACTEVLEVP